MRITSKEEIELVLAHRARQESYREKLKQREECKHSFRYDGHGHNDDAYLCTKCGETEWR